MGCERLSDFVRPSFEAVGLANVTGDRSSQDRQHSDGVDIVHAIIDDHSRLAYAEIHSDERAATVAGFLQRALAFYSRHGIRQAADDRQCLGLHAQPRGAAPALTTITSATSPQSPTGRAPTARSNAYTRRWRANGSTLVYQSHHDRATALPALAQPLQHDAATRLTRRPTPDQPRSQRP